MTEDTDDVRRDARDFVRGQGVHGRGELAEHERLDRIWERVDSATSGRRRLSPQFAVVAAIGMVIALGGVAATIRPWNIGQGDITSPATASSGENETTSPYRGPEPSVEDLIASSELVVVVGPHRPGKSPVVEVLKGRRADVLGLAGHLSEVPSRRILFVSDDGIRATYMETGKTFVKERGTGPESIDLTTLRRHIS